jgi:hypothetical protein
MVIFIHYGIGFFVPSQEDSTVIRFFAITLNLIGAIIYIAVFSLICWIVKTMRDHNLANQRRLTLVS